MAAGGLGDRGVAGALRVGGVPVFTYHGLFRDGRGTPGGDARYWLPASTFRAQLATLRGDGVRAATIDDLWTGAPAVNGDGPRSAVITFDDGRVSDFELAFPLLGRPGPAPNSS